MSGSGAVRHPDRRCRLGQLDRPAGARRDVPPPRSPRQFGRQDRTSLAGCCSSPLLAGGGWHAVRHFVYGGDRGRIGALATGVAKAARRGSSCRWVILEGAGRELASISCQGLRSCGRESGRWALSAASCSFIPWWPRPSVPNSPGSTSASPRLTPRWRRPACISTISRPGGLYCGAQHASGGRAR